MDKRELLMNTGKKNIRLVKVYVYFIYMDKERRRAYNIEYQRMRRLDPKYRERQRIYLKKRRLDPEFIARNKIYLKNFRKKRDRARDLYHSKKNTQSPKRTDRVVDSILLDRLFGSVLILE